MTPGAALDNPEIAKRFPDYRPPLDRQSAITEANRCLYCFDAPCTAACPTHIDVPRFIKKIATGNERGSALAILEANILGASCARVCPVDVLCEGACVLHRYNRSPIQIGRLQRYAMDHFYQHGAVLPPLNVTPKAQRIACIGAGPASLACAAELRRLGYSVTIFEARPLPGGLNTYGVAEYKLRAADSLREVQLVESMGIDFQFNAEIHTLADIEKQFDAVFLGLGLGQMEPLNIPGENLPGVLDALHLIARYKTDQSAEVGRRIVVIGGGNTAIDAAIAARRLGAPLVTMVYRRSESEMPAFHYEYQHAQLEGVEFVWQTQPVRILPDPDTGRVGAVECVLTEPGPPDASGRHTPVPVSGTEFLLPCDMVIPALGQSRLRQLLASVPQIEMHGGCVVIDRPTGRTGHPKFYAGGDCVNGGREVVDAVADGKRAALGIARALESHHG